MIKLNLLPPERRKKLKKVKPVGKKAGAVEAVWRARPALRIDPYVLAPAAAVIVAVVLIAGSFFWLGYKEKNARGRRDSMRVELNLLNQVILRIDNLKEQTKKISQRMEVILKVDRNRYLWPRILDELSAALPRYTWLESVSEIKPFPQLTLRIEGNTMSNLLLSSLLANLEKSSLLSSIKLISSAEQTHGAYETKYFIIECSSALNEPVDSAAVATK